MPPELGSSSGASKKVASTLTSIPLPSDYSDSDPSYKPDKPNYQRGKPDIYLQKLANKWMEEKGLKEKGKTYMFERLPAGYIMYEKQRPNLNLRDKYLYGHPAHQYFDSTTQFYPHFKYLMSRGKEKCNCIACTGDRYTLNSSRKPSRESEVVMPSRSKANEPAAITANSSPHPPTPPVPATIPRRRGRPSLPRSDHETGKVKFPDGGSTDAEGTPDVYQGLFAKFKNQGTIHQAIKEQWSMDWRAERNQLPDMIKKVTTKQYSFVPRVGELVLWCREMGVINYDSDNEQYKLYDNKTNEYLGFPKWMAGTVGQASQEWVCLEDTIMQTKKSYAINRSGFRVECFPDPNDNDKAYSKQYAYVPLHHIRPFVFYREIMHGIPIETWHPSISHALTVSCSMSLVDKYYIKGTWPNAIISSKGIYIGPEVIFVGDVVRIIPPENVQEVTDVLWVKSVRMMTNVDKDVEISSLNLESGKASSFISIHLVGKAYTIDKRRAYSPVPVEREKLIANFPWGMREWEWYPLHSEMKSYKISFDRVLSRCFESDALILWFGEKDLSLGLEGMRNAHRFSRKFDIRLKDKEPLWYWGDSRAGCLDLETLNGYEVGKWDESRDPKMWLKTLRTIDGVDGRTNIDIAAAAAKKRSDFGKSVSSGPSTIVSNPNLQRTSLVASALQYETPMHDEDDNSDDNADNDDDEAATDAFIGDLAQGKGFGPLAEDPKRKGKMPVSLSQRTSNVITVDSEEDSGDSSSESDSEGNEDERNGRRSKRRRLLREI
ncbi:MAG: hypothetical protein M1834_006954 [Cirrosporium novae-zelandiae]|nr:MAG: hypothetical protein M1834_006954 [Cirrosporium novae-zelandiae]